jgi:hypothetical protein
MRTWARVRVEVERVVSHAMVVRARWTVRLRPCVSGFIHGGDGSD